MSNHASYTRGICLVDGCNNVQEKWDKIRSGDRKQTYRLICTTHRRLPAKFKRERCENISCKWSGEFGSYILEVDHIDGNRKNNVATNFQTICGICHLIKTNQERNRK